MVDANCDVEAAIASLHSTMKCCKAGIKDRVFLPKLTDLSPVIHNEMRWSWIYHMLARITRIRDSLLSVANSYNYTLTIDLTAAIKNKALLYEKHFAEIHFVTVQLKKLGLSLCASRFIIDELIDAVKTGCHDFKSPIYQCKLGRAYIQTDA